MRTSVFMLLLATTIGCNSCSREFASSTPLAPSNTDSLIVPAYQDNTVMCTIAVHNITHYAQHTALRLVPPGHTESRIDTIFTSWECYSTQVQGELHNDTVVVQDDIGTIRLVLSADLSEVRELHISQSTSPDLEDDPREPNVQSSLLFVGTHIPLVEQVGHQRYYRVAGEETTAHIVDFYKWYESSYTYGNGGQYNDTDVFRLLRPFGSEADSYISITLVWPDPHGWQEGAMSIRNDDLR